jgi:hypothetical protein
VGALHVAAQSRDLRDNPMKESIMKTRTSLKAGGRKFNHNETLSRDAVPATKRSTFRVRTAVPAGLSGMRR